MNNILTEFSDRGLVWSLHRASDAAGFDYVLVMKGGRIVDHGKFDDVIGDGSALSELIAAE